MHAGSTLSHTLVQPIMFVIALARGVPLLQSTYPNKVIGLIPCNVEVLLEVVRAGTSKSKVRVWSRSPDPIDSIGQPLSIRIGHISTLQGIEMKWYKYMK